MELSFSYVCGDLMWAQHRTCKLLLGHGIIWRGGTAWTNADHQWLAKQHFDQLGLHVARNSSVVGLLAVAPDAARGRYRLADAAYEKRSVAISSDLHPAAFDELMLKTLATARADSTKPMSVKPPVTASGPPRPLPGRESAN